MRGIAPSANACRLAPCLPQAQPFCVPSKEEIIAKLLQPGLIAVVRARSAEQVIPLAHALLRGGIRAVEITMTTPNALVAIREASQQLPTEALVGVGTVLD